MESTVLYVLDWTKFFAFIGVLAITFAVGKWGFLPVLAWLKARAAAAATVEQRIIDLEKKVEKLWNDATHRTAVPFTPSPAPASAPDKQGDAGA